MDDDDAMLPAELLSRALRLKWVLGSAEKELAVRSLAGQFPGFRDSQYSEAWQLVMVLDGAAYELAAAWFESKGREPGPTADDLKCLCPGFRDEDYADAIGNNILWARK